MLATAIPRPPGSATEAHLQQEDRAVTPQALPRKETTPDSWRSNACPLRRSWHLKDEAFSVPMPARTSRSARRAAAGDMPTKSFVPSGSASSTGPRTCRGQVTCGR